MADQTSIFKINNLDSLESLNKGLLLLMYLRNNDKLVMISFMLRL